MAVNMNNHMNEEDQWFEILLRDLLDEKQKLRNELNRLNKEIQVLQLKLQGSPPV
jgi:hypothetical protein